MSYTATKIGTEFQVNTYSNTYQDFPTVSSFSNNRFIVIWRTYSIDTGYQGMRGQLFSSAGIKSGTEFEVTADASYEDYPSSVSSLSDGRFVITWLSTPRDTNTWEIYGQIYNNIGVKSGTVFQINTDNSYRQTAPAVSSFSDGGFVIIWSCNGICGQLYNSTGEKSDTIQFIASTVIGAPSVSSFSDGRFVVTWYAYCQDDSYYKIYGQLFSSTGEKSGAEFLVNTNPGYNDLDSPSVSSFSNNRFIVTWPSYLQEGVLEWGIYGQLYNNAGEKSGTEFQVSTGTSSAQSVTSLSDNGFVVIWMDDDFRICVQLYNSTGVKSDTEFQGSISNAINVPSAAPFGDNKFVVTWRCNNDICGQLYSTRDSTCTHSSASLDSLKPYDLALLSLKVYDDPADSGIALPSGWEASISSDDASLSNNGYFARVYIKDDTAVITQRGTEDLTDIANDVLLFFDQVSLQFPPAKAFFNYTTSYLCNSTSVSHIAFAGHSLGAALAELSSAQFKFPAMTFESPGTREILTAQSDDFPSDAISYVDKNVVTYNAAPNLVNTMAKHVGSISRVYPSVDSMLIGKEASKSAAIYPFYVWDYSIQGQHKMGGIVNIFNSNTQEPTVVGAQEPWPHGTIIGYNGFDHYKSYYTNPYYWNCVVSYKTKDTGGYITSWFDKFQDALREATLSVPKVGANVTGDNIGNTIWGTTSFSDTITGGTGDDIHYMHQGDDYSIDTGGTNKYIMPIGILGKKTIDDATNTGSIWLYNEQFKGEAIPVLQSSCPTLPVGSYYLNLGKAGSYYLTEQEDDLFIAADCAETTSELQNTLTLKNFAWGDFNINKYLNNDTGVLVGSNGDDYLDCNLYKKLLNKCFIDALAGEDIIVSEVGKDVVIVGHDLGNKVFKLLDSQEDSSRKSFQSEGSASINIFGIKEGDILDLTGLDLTSAPVTQDETHMQIDLGNNNIVIAEIIMGNSFVNFDFADGVVTVSNKDMIQVLEDAGITMANNGSIINVTPNNPPPPIPPDPNSGSNDEDSNSWLIPTIISVSSVVAIAIVGMVGWRCYHSHKGTPGNYQLMTDVV